MSNRQTPRNETSEPCKCTALTAFLTLLWMPTADPIITQSLCNQIRSPTVDGCEILHQLVVYPSIFGGVQPSQIGGAGFRWPIHSSIFHVRQHAKVREVRRRRRVEFTIPP